MTICFATEAEARLEETKRHVEDCAGLKREIRTEPRIRTILTYISMYTYIIYNHIYIYIPKGVAILKLQKNLHPVTE